MKVTLKDGSVKEYAQPMAVIDIAKDISEGLARMACVAEINGEEADLSLLLFLPKTMDSSIWYNLKKVNFEIGILLNWIYFSFVSRL